MIEEIITKTPIQRIDLPDGNGCRFWIKRDDLLPFSFGGNKVRIAKAYMDDCIRRECDAIIMYGDKRSNLCRVLGSLCRTYGMECLMIATSEHDESAQIPYNKRIIDRLGIRVLHCSKTSIAETVDQAFALLEKEGRKPYYIYGNRLGEGNEGVAAAAYVKAAEEIREQEEEIGEAFDYLFTACGTGGTLGGLTAGMLECGSACQVIGISISSRSRERQFRSVRSAAYGYYEKAGRKVPEDLDAHLHADCDHNCGGYGVIDPRVIELIDQVFRNTSIPLDPTYTGKAMRGMLDVLQEKGITGKNVLFLHTGGGPLFFDYLK